MTIFKKKEKPVFKGEQEEIKFKEVLKKFKKEVEEVSKITCRLRTIGIVPFMIKVNNTLTEELSECRKSLTEVTNERDALLVTVQENTTLKKKYDMLMRTISEMANDEHVKAYGFITRDVARSLLKEIERVS